MLNWKGLGWTICGVLVGMALGCGGGGGAGGGDVTSQDAGAQDTSSQDTSGQTDGGGDTNDATGDNQDGGDNTIQVTECSEVDRTVDAEAPETGQDLTLSGTYRISGTITYDNDEEITIEPGTVFLMEADARFRTGWRSDPVTIDAKGTEEEPILFCGTDGSPGHWQGLSVQSGTKSNSLFEHVRVEDAGADDHPALQLDADATLSSVTVTNNGAVGMKLTALGEESSDLTVTGNDGKALDLEGRNAITHLPSGTYSGNGTDVALASEFENTNTVFHAIDIPYRQDTERPRFGTASGDKKSLTFEAGVEYQFCQDCYIQMGWRNDEAALQVKGESDNPVIFTSHRGDEAQTGDWNGIEILGGTTSDSSIEHAEFHYGGKSGGGNVIINKGNIRISNSLFTDSLGAGIKIEEEGAILELSDNSFDNNAEGDVVRTNN